MPGATIRRAWPWMLVALVTQLSLANAWRFADRVANPLVHADSWYFLDAFVEPWDSGELGWREFFIKRGSNDHAQPLHRLGLLLNLETQELDFGFEARLAMLGLSLLVLLLLGLGIAHLRRELRYGSQPHGVSIRWQAVLPLVLLPAMVVSLNSHEIYYWSLVNFFHVSLLPALLLIALVCWRFRPDLPARDPWWIGPLVAAASFLVQLALDGAGLLAAAALLPVLAWAAWRLHQPRRALILAAWMLGGLLAYRVGYSVLFPMADPAEVATTSDALAYLLAHRHEAVRWLMHPAVASLVHPMHLPFWVEASTEPRLRGAIALLVLVLHALFWCSLARDRRPAPLSLFAAAMMLLVYGMVAGILLSRLPQFGTDYLLQSRYVAFYQLANAPLLLHLVVVLSRHSVRVPRGQSAAIIVLVLAGFWLQGLLTQRAWEQAPYIQQYIRDMAGNVLCLAQHPGLAAPTCQPGNSICATGPEARDRLVALLQRRRLNLFAPGFRERHALDEGIDAASCLAPPP
jgi:hypothetical protein